jgi:hypothetical protein
MNAITEALVARESVTSQTGFATIDTAKASAGATDDGMANRRQDWSSRRPLGHSPAASLVTAGVDARQGPRLPRHRLQLAVRAPRKKHMPRGLIIARGMRAMSDPTPIQLRYCRGPRLICLASASLVGGMGYVASYDNDENGCNHSSPYGCHDCSQSLNKQGRIAGAGSA